MYTVRQALDILETGALCSLQVITYDRQQKTGGKLRSYAEVQLLQAEDTHEPALISRAKNEAESPDIVRKDPNHRENYTRNVRIFQEGHPTAEIRSIHPPLIVRINNKTVAT